MKRIVVAIILLFLVISVIFAGNITINYCCKEVNRDVEEIKQLILNDDTKSATDKINSLQNNWHKKKELISIFSSHSPLDEITVSIEELSHISNISSKPLSVLKCAKIAAYIKRIQEEQRIHAESFF